MTTDVTYHTTEEAEVLFMNAAKPLKNKYKNYKEEYSIKLKFLEGSKTIAHLAEVAESKIDTKVNRKLVGEKHVSFSSTYPPIVLDADKHKLTGDEIPYFDGRKDKARAIVVYKIIHYLNSKIVRLQAIQILNLELAPREEYKPVDKILDEIKQFLN